jgi:hypothetical protein
MKILDAKYEKAELDAYLKLVNHLDNNQKSSLKPLLNKYEHLFDGLLGYWKTDPVDLRLKTGEMPFQLSPFLVPKVYEETLKKEINRLCDKKKGTVRVVSDFRVLNSTLQRVSYPMPRIQDILISLNGFIYTTSIYLILGYYASRLMVNAQKLCTIVC